MYEELGLTQAQMSLICGVNKSAISRYIKQENLKPVNEKSRKYQRYSIEKSREIISNCFKGGGLPRVIKKVQPFYNFKGGTGKTSLSFQVSTMLSLMGYRVLAIDSDPQSHLSATLGFLDQDSFTLYDVIANRRSIKDCIVNVYEGLDLLPSNLSLTRLESKLNELPKREERLNSALENIKDDYDFIIIDTNPNISLLNRNVVTAANKINIVCETQTYSINGLGILMEDLHSFYSMMDIPTPDILIIPNRYEERMSTSQESMGLLLKYYRDHLIPDFVVRKSEDINIAAKKGLSLPFFCKSNSNALEDMISLVHHIIFSSSFDCVEKEVA